MSRLRTGLPPAPSIERIALATGNGRTKNKMRRGKLPVGADGCHANLFAPATGSGRTKK